jgi:ribosomal-protein-alanine N-acetyltransferase
VDIDIYVAKAFDTAVLAALHTLCFGIETGEPWTPEAFAQLIAMPGCAALIATGSEENDPVGYLVFRAVADECEIISMGVHPRARRQSIATQLLSRMYACGRENGAARIYLEVAADNIDALFLYRKQRFTKVGERPNYYTRLGAARTDAIVLKRNLQASD